MRPTRSRLVCRAHNRFTPSIALWQHFVTPERPSRTSQRLASSATDAVENGVQTVSPETAGYHEPSGLDELEAELKRDHELRSNTTGIITTRLTPTTRFTRVRKPKSIKETNWKPNKVDASIAKNKARMMDAREASVAANERLLSTAKAAFEKAQDYEGVVVMPMTTSQPVKESALPWCVENDGSTMTGVQRLNLEIQQFYEYAKPNHLETAVRKQLIEQVRVHVRKTLPKYVLEVFGSEKTGLSLPTSDIDFRLMKKEQLEDPAISKLPPTPGERANVMKALRHLYSSNLSKNGAYMLSAFRHARYPLISLQDKKSGLDVQVVLSNDTSMSREFMHRYMEQYPHLRQLYYVVKTMFDVRGLSDVFRGGIGSYSLFMMIVASMQHKPHQRADAAGALLNFFKFYIDFDITKQGISLEPPWLFDKEEVKVQTDTVKAKLAEGTAKPLPAYSLCLRDPADETNDLGRKALAIRHVQATFRQICIDLNRDITLNTRASLLGPLVGSSFRLYYELRNKIRQYGFWLNGEMHASLAAKAKAIREGNLVTTEQSDEEKEKARLAREAADKERARLAEERNEKLGAEAERTAVLEHGDAMASTLGVPSVQHDGTSGDERATLESSTQETPSEAETEGSGTLLAHKANPDAEKRSIDATFADQQPEKQ